jgi:hypothetical protein
MLAPKLLRNGEEPLLFNVVGDVFIVVFFLLETTEIVGYQLASLLAVIHSHSRDSRRLGFT